MAFRTKLAFLCDDVRREDNGKMLYIGVYSGGIQIAAAQEGAVIISTLVVVYHVDGPGTYTIDFRITTPTGAIVTARGILGVAEPPGQYEMNTVTVPNLTIPIAQLGVIKCELKLAENEIWETVLITPLLLPS